MGSAGELERLGIEGRYPNRTIASEPQIVGSNKDRASGILQDGLKLARTQREHSHIGLGESILPVGEKQGLITGKDLRLLKTDFAAIGIGPHQGLPWSAGRGNTHELVESAGSGGSKIDVAVVPPAGAAAINGVAEHFRIAAGKRNSGQLVVAEKAQPLRVG